MNNEILNELAGIDEQINELAVQITKLEDELVSASPKNGNDALLVKLTNFYDFYRNKYTEILEKTKAVLILDNSWCDAVKKGIPSDSIAVIPIIDVDFDSIESVEDAIKQAEDIIIAADGSINFDGISSDFIEFYRNLRTCKHEYTEQFYNNKLVEISNAYSNGIAQKINEYKVTGEETKYNIGGVIYELDDKTDFWALYDAVNEYELTRELGQEVTPTEVMPNIEIIEPIPLSQVSPEVKARFGITKKDKMVELKSGAIAKIKEFKAKTDKTIRLIGGKLVATKNNLASNLKAYYSHVNIANANNMEMDIPEPKTLPAGDESYVQPEETRTFESVNATGYGMKTPDVIVPTINEVPETINGIPETIKVVPAYETVEPVENVNVVPFEPAETKVNMPMNNKEALLSKYYDLIRERVLGKHAGELRNLHQEQIDFEIDNYLDNLIKVGEEKYGDNFITDIMNEPSTEPIKWLMDEVSQGENLKEISEDTINKTVNQIDNMDEYEFENYLKVTLGKDDLGEFNSHVDDYMAKHPNTNEFTASKEALKAMIDKVELAKPSSVMESKYIQVPNEPASVLEPVVIEPGVINTIEETKTLKPVYEENITVTIDKMNEVEFAEYVNGLNLSMEELNMFNSLVKKYKEDYPGVTKTFAEKACIKTILDQRKIEQSKTIKTSTI